MQLCPFDFNNAPKILSTTHLAYCQCMWHHLYVDLRLTCWQIVSRTWTNQLLIDATACRFTFQYHLSLNEHSCNVWWAGKIINQTFKLLTLTLKAAIKVIDILTSALEYWMPFASILMVTRELFCKTLELHCQCHFWLHRNRIPIDFVWCAYGIVSILLTLHDIILWCLHENNNPSRALEEKKDFK